MLAPARNKLIRELFHEDYKDQDLDHAEYFLDQEHIFPCMAREFSDHMLTGERRRISGMVETTKTVIKTAMASGTLTLIDIEGILRHEDKQLRQLTEEGRVLKPPNYCDLLTQTGRASKGLQLVPLDRRTPS